MSTPCSINPTTSTRKKIVRLAAVGVGGGALHESVPVHEVSAALATAPVNGRQE